MSYNNYDKIEYESTYYYSRDSRYSLVKGTQTSSTNVWTGNLPEGINSYTDPENLIIDYYLPYAGTSSGATLNLSSLGALPVYASHGTTQITDEFEAKSVLRLAYIVDSGLNSGNGAWKVIGSDASGSGGGGEGKTYTLTNTYTEIGSATDNGDISIGSASAGTAISADDITNWSAGSVPTMTFSAGTISFSAGSAPSLSYTSRTIPNISVTTKTIPNISVTTETVVSDAVLTSS